MFVIDKTAQRPLRLILISTVLALTAWNSLAGPSAKEREIAALKQQILEWQQRATVAEVESNRLKREIGRLKTELEEARQTEPCPGPEEVEVEPTSPETIGLDQQIEESDIDAPPIVVAEPIAPEPALETEGDLQNPPPAIPADLPEQETQPVASATPTAAAQELYDEGYALFHQNRYSDAEERFRRYIELFPETNLADNALFWIGECRYARGEFNSALEAFSDTVERFPHSNKVSDALLKAGKCLESLGDPQQALTTYEEVVSRYPDSAAAAQAHDRLKALR